MNNSNLFETHSLFSGAPDLSKTLAEETMLHGAWSALSGAAAASWRHSARTAAPCAGWKFPVGTALSSIPYSLPKKLVLTGCWNHTTSPFRWPFLAAILCLLGLLLQVGLSAFAVVFDLQFSFWAELGPGWARMGLVYPGVTVSVWWTLANLLRKVLCLEMPCLEVFGFQTAMSIWACRCHLVHLTDPRFGSLNGPLVISTIEFSLLTHNSSSIAW